MNTKARLVAIVLIIAPLVAEGGPFTTWQGYDEGSNSLYAFAGDRLWEHGGSVLHRLVISRNGKDDNLNQCFMFNGSGVPLMFCEERQGASLSGAVWVQGKEPRTMECASRCTASVPRFIEELVENEEGDSGGEF